MYDFTQKQERLLLCGKLTTELTAAPLKGFA